MLCFLGELVLLQKIELTIVSTEPPLFEFHLTCVTSGGPLAVAYWTRNKANVNNATFSYTFVISDYINAVYNHTLTVTGNFPGTYEFHVQDPFTETLITDSHDVEGRFADLDYVKLMCKYIGSRKSFYCHSDLCSGNSQCNGINSSISCDEGYEFNELKEACIGKGL